MTHRTISEWQTLAYGPESHQIPVGVADRLAATARLSSIGGEEGRNILTLGRKELRAGQIVGVIAAEGCSLEILPKIDGLGDNGARHQLIHMLSVVLDLKISALDLTTVGVQEESVLEVLIRLFAQRVTDAVRRGMPRSYRDEHDDLKVLRGRLDVKRQFTIHAATPQRIACSYSTLSADIPLNQVMKAAISRLSKLARSQHVKRLLTELTFIYSDISEVRISSLRWDLIKLDRTKGRWLDLLNLARLLLGGHFQTTSFGKSSGFSLLFEMNILFEEYVARTLSKALSPDGFQVVIQGGRLFCLSEVESGRQRFQTRPDILIKRDGKVRMVIDTKWKRLVPLAEDVKRGISQSDIYQMMAYARLYNSPRVLLLYPHHSGIGPQEGVLSRYRLNGSNDLLLGGTIDIAERQDFHTRLRSATLAAME